MVSFYHLFSGRLLSLVFICVLLNACATTQAMYDWGNYEEDLYRYYKQASSRSAAMENLQRLVNRLEARNRIVPPGLYSELGTYYLEAQRADQAVLYYTKEAQVWPESKKLMDTLVANLVKNGVKAPEQGGL